MAGILRNQAVSANRIDGPFRRRVLDFLNPREYRVGYQALIASGTNLMERFAEKRQHGLAWRYECLDKSGQKV